MAPAICALVCFAALTMLLAFLYANYRVLLVLGGRAKANAWTRGAQTVTDPAIITRIQHAHYNCVENLPVFAAVVFAAYASNKLGIVNEYAFLFLGLRLAQVITHTISASHAAVFIRANFWIAQVALTAYWVYELCVK